MKHILLFLALVATSLNVNAQAFASYGHSSSLSRSYTTIGHSPYVVRLNGYDTLTASTGVTDTGWVQWNLPNKYNQVIDVFVKSLTGTLAGTLWIKASNAATMPVVGSYTWDGITASTTYCTSCAAYSVAISGSGTTKYTYHLPPDAEDYQYYQIMVVATGTCTATYTARIVTKS